MHYAEFANDETGAKDLMINADGIEIFVRGHGSARYEISVDRQTAEKIKAVTFWEQPYTREQFGDALMWANARTIASLVKEVAHEGLVVG